jgi:hypothetical protein
VGKSWDEAMLPTSEYRFADGIPVMLPQPTAIGIVDDPRR